MQLATPSGFQVNHMPKPCIVPGIQMPAIFGVRQDVRGVTTNSPPPNRVRTARAHAREHAGLGLYRGGLGLERGGLGLGLEPRCILYVLVKKMVLLDLDLMLVNIPGVEYERNQHTTRNVKTQQTAAPSTCHAQRPFHARCCPSARNANSSHSLSAPR